MGACYQINDRLTLAASPFGFRYELWWPPGDPFNKFCDPWMQSKRLDRSILSCYLSFGQTRMNFLVAHVMQQNCRAAFAALEFGDEVMLALRDPLGNWSLT